MTRPADIVVGLILPDVPSLSASDITNQFAIASPDTAVVDNLKVVLSS